MFPGFGQTNAPASVGVSQEGWWWARAETWGPKVGDQPKRGVDSEKRSHKAPPAEQFGNIIRTTDRARPWKPWGGTGRCVYFPNTFLVHLFLFAPLPLSEIWAPGILQRPANSFLHLPHFCPSAPPLCRKKDPPGLTALMIAHCCSHKVTFPSMVYKACWIWSLTSCQLASLLTTILKTLSASTLLCTLWSLGLCTFCFPCLDHPYPSPCFLVFPIHLLDSQLCMFLPLGSLLCLPAQTQTELLTTLISKLHEDASHSRRHTVAFNTCLLNK